MAVANTLAYYIMATITTVKSFIVQDPGFPFFLIFIFGDMTLSKTTLSHNDFQHNSNPHNAINSRARVK
jgi:hypothetical protein